MTTTQIKIKKIASVDEAQCVGCGSCIKACPRGAVSVPQGIAAKVDEAQCVGCGLCAKACPASVISVKEVEKRPSPGRGKAAQTAPKSGKKRRPWYDYLWIASLTYLILGFVNILFAWLGLICFFVPLGISIVKGNKAYCNKYCGRGQLFDLLGTRLGLSRKRDMPRFLKSTAFRYGFLIFFLAMFGNMLFSTYLVFAGAGSLRQAVTLLWTFKLPWQFAYHGTLFAPWVAQFSFGFYSVMLTSTVLGLVTMILFKPRSWCAYCPMGTMTQGICRLKHRGESEKTATEAPAGLSCPEE